MAPTGCPNCKRLNYLNIKLITVINKYLEEDPNRQQAAKEIVEWMKQDEAQ